MIGRKTILSMCMLCALAVAGFAAQSASAQTAYTCLKIAGGPFATDHCTTQGPPKEYAHVEIAIPTNITGTGGTTKLKSVQSGVTLELQSTSLTGTGSMENVEEGGEMVAKGTGVIKYKGVTVTQPAGKGCVVTGGEVVTKELAASTKGLTNELKFTPKAGETAAFAEFTVSSCSIAALNHLYTAKGSVKGQTSGATTKFTHENTTGQKTLTLSGQLAGIEGELTITRTSSGNGLALT
jgi:hypothetical protein